MTCLTDRGVGGLIRETGMLLELLGILPSNLRAQHTHPHLYLHHGYLGKPQKIYLNEEQILTGHSHGFYSRWLRILLCCAHME